MIRKIILFSFLFFFVACLGSRSADNGGELQANHAFISVVKRDFAGWDKNHNGILEEGELDEAISNASVKNESAAALAAIKRAVRKSRETTPALTPDEIAKMAETAKPPLDLMFGESLKRIQDATDRTLFAGEEPGLEHIRQGKLGNCFCLAPLGAMTARNPQEVKQLFSVLKEGVYSVKIGTNKVTVSQPTDAEIALSSSTSKGGVWVNVYEKAVGQGRVDKLSGDEKNHSVLDAVGKGGSAGTMLAELTGLPMTRFSFKFFKQPLPLDEKEYHKKLSDLRSQLQLATEERRLMTCGTLKVTTPGLTPNHAYAVLKFVPTDDSVELWNPHGQEFTPKGEPGIANGYTTHHGVFRIKLEDMVHQFSGMAFEVAKAPPAT